MQARAKDFQIRDRTMEKTPKTEHNANNSAGTATLAGEKPPVRSAAPPHSSTLAYAFWASVPVMAGYIVLGFGFGVLLQKAGYSWIWALVMSAAIYAGSMQYVAVDLLSAGASLITAALMTLMVNIRHLFYGITMLRPYQDAGRAKPYLIFALTDETFSLVCSPELPGDADRKKYYLYLSAMNQCYWIFGSVLGAVLGEQLNFNSLGIDFSMTALFTVIFVEQWEQSRNHIPALCGVGISLLCLILFGPSRFLIPSMLLIAAAMFLLRPLMDKDEVLQGRAEPAASEEHRDEGKGVQP